MDRLLEHYTDNGDDILEEDCDQAAPTSSVAAAAGSKRPPVAAAAATAASKAVAQSVGADGLTDEQRRIQRAQRFGMPVKSDDAKVQRAKRFGLPETAAAAATAVSGGALSVRGPCGEEKGEGRAAGLGGWEGKLHGVERKLEHGAYVIT